MQDPYREKYLKYKQKYDNLMQNKYNGQSFDLAKGGKSVQVMVHRDLQQMNNAKGKLDNIHFWGNQIREHMLFFHLGLEVPELKKQALELHEYWNKYLLESFEKKNIQANKIILDDSDFQKLGDLNPLIQKEVLAVLLDKTMNFKKTIRAKLEAGQWIGWIYLSFAKHVIKEAEFFVKKIKDEPISVEEEIKFWNDVNGEHMGLASHLLDPEFENDALIAKANAFYHQHKILNQNVDKTFLDLSIKFTEELSKFAKETQVAVHNGSVHSLIHPMLIDHDVREGERSMKMLQKMKEFIQMQNMM